MVLAQGCKPTHWIPIQIWKKKFADKLHKSYKKHTWQTSPTFSGHFTLQAEPKINWNNYISMVLWACFSNKVCIYQTRQIWGIWKLRPAYAPETPNLGQNWWCFVPCDLEIWWMTLENNRASLLCCFKLCATFHSHWWIQTWVTVRKRPIWVKIDDF